MNPTRSIRIFRNHERYSVKSKWKIQDAIYWINLRKRQDNGLTFWQTWSHAVIFYDSVPADCIEKVVSTKNEEILYQRIPIPRSPPKKCVERSLASTTRQRFMAANRHREINSKTTSECKASHIKQCLKIEDARPGSNSWRTHSKFIPGRSH